MRTMELVRSTASRNEPTVPPRVDLDAAPITNARFPLWHDFSLELGDEIYGPIGRSAVIQRHGDQAVLNSVVHAVLRFTKQHFGDRILFTVPTQSPSEEQADLEFWAPTPPTSEQRVVMIARYEGHGKLPKFVDPFQD